MQLTKRHHYTPRYYLKRFENADGALWRLDTETGQIAKGNNERFGFKNNWNRLRNPPFGYAPDWAERQIAQIDGHASAVIAEILAGNFPKDIGALAAAISFMLYNQPRLMREIDATHAAETAHWTEDHRLIVKLRTAIDNAKSYIPLYYALKFIGDDLEGARFLTSSNPVIDFENKPTMFLPLSSRHCLFMSFDPAHEHFRPGTIACDAPLIAEINKLTVRNSWHYVYSSTPDFD